MKLFAFFYLLDNLIYHRSAFAAVYRYSSHPSEQNSQRKEKPFFLHHKAGFTPYRANEKLADEQVPIGGMRSCADNTLVEVRNIDFSFPA